jgi:putative transposase
MAKQGRICRHLLAELLKEQDGDVLREGIRVLSQALMETEVAGLIGAERHERRPDRLSQWQADPNVGHPDGNDRNRDPQSTTRGLFSSLLQPKRRAKHALLAVVQEAYVHGCRRERSMIW